MRRCTGHIGLLVAGLLSLAIAAACTVRIPEGNDTAVPVVFDPVMYIPVKAANPGEYPADVPFCASVWDTDGTSGTARPFLSRARISRNGSGIWVPDPAALWPEKTQHIVTLAASPYGAESSISMTDGIVFTGVDTATDQTDLLYTDPVPGVSRFADSGVVNLPFRHALCLLDFEMRCNATEGESATLDAVSLDQVSCRGSFASLPHPEWTTSGAAQEVTFFQGKQEITHTNEPVGDTRWTIPQPLSAKVVVRLVYRSADEKITGLTLESTPLNFLLEPGRHYTFTLSCMLDTKSLKIDIIDNLI